MTNLHSETVSINEQDTFATQEISDSFAFDDVEPLPMWGRLFSVGNGFTPLDLVNDNYSFGRDSDVDYSFEKPVLKATPFFINLSKLHFKLVRILEPGNNYHVYLEDKSSNGTFINGSKVGKNSRQVINNNDEISLATSPNKAFIFIDVALQDKLQNSLPTAFSEQYTLSRVLGSGACGEVRLAFSKGSCEKYAVKIVQKKKFSIGGNCRANLAAKSVVGEVTIMKKLSHPGIVKIVDVFDTKDAFYIILELIEGGELFDRVVNKGQLDDATAKLYFYQMLLAVQYLHDQNITHRDLKPENVLLGSDMDETIVKVTDFGLSRFVGEQSLMQTLCGTPTYLAPEILSANGSFGTAAKGYDKSVDCWSLGVILYVMLGGYPPFAETKGMTLNEQITRGSYQFPSKVWKDVKKEAIDLIKKLVVVDPAKRFTAEKALQHKWLNDEGMHQQAVHLMGDSMMKPPSSPLKKRIGSPNQSPPKRAVLPSTPLLGVDIQGAERLSKKTLEFEQVALKVDTSNLTPTSSEVTGSGDHGDAMETVPPKGRQLKAVRGRRGRGK